MAEKAKSFRLVALACTTALGCAQLLAVDELAPVEAKADVAGAGGGSGVECTEASTCPAPTTPCRVAACDAGV
ncbi:MAG: hypothetical protein FJ096_08140, partial [Deltaproteobacteria bacterium]|nr:hypothetical protein [Deltaproteobacteria bacterium]